jgi:hypothetical protein
MKDTGKMESAKVNNMQKEGNNSKHIPRGYHFEGFQTKI